MFFVRLSLFVVALAALSVPFTQSVSADCAGPSDHVSEVYDRDDSQGWLCCGVGPGGLVATTIPYGMQTLFPLGTIDTYAEADAECILQWILLGPSTPVVTCSKRAIRTPAHYTTCLDFNEEEIGCCYRELEIAEELVTSCQTIEDEGGEVVDVECVVTVSYFYNGTTEIVATPCVEPQVVGECLE